ncbi:Helitron helicase [Phytophthora megakarya]|uniref:Helitron helicase n=1 Tax=Phytophthora megakarya TaxID=4795 RepID=A0A225WBU1_9STRA|nr:Helitron helicase [Phytophthora megakarya]
MKVDPVNEDIGECDICLPHDMYVFSLDVPPIRNEPRDEDADSDSDSGEDDETEPFPNFNLLPSVDDHNSRDLDFMVHDAAPDSDNVPPEVDDADDDRRTRNVNALIDAVCSGINRDELPNELRVVSRRERSIEATAMSGPAKGNTVFIPRIIFYTEDDDMGFPFKLKPFAMTINKTQGQSSHHVDIYLESPVFAHGQLNIAISRVTSQKEIKFTVGPEMIDVNTHQNYCVQRIFYHKVA